MKTREDTSMRFKSNLGGNIDVTVPKGADIRNLITNILLVAPPEDIEEVLYFIGVLADEIKQNQIDKT